MLNQENSDRGENFPGAIDLPDDHDGPEEEEHAPAHSLTDDLGALLDDGRTYLEAEIAYQKSRGVFVADRAKGAVAFGLGAFGFLHLALVAATVGAVLALIPLVGPWAATGIVTIVLVLAGAAMLRLLRRRFEEIKSAFLEDGK